MIGQTLHHYRIEARLGEGGMGEVYRAEDLRLGRPVALKFLSPDLANDPRWRERLAREARAASALSSPFVAATYELAEHDDLRFIAMEFVEGELLSTRLAREALSLSRAVRLGRQVAEALEEAHERGVIHRDIKPANLMLTRHARVKILDFGIAKLDSALLRPPDPDAPTLTLSETTPGTLIGTVSYMSPEQALGRDVDPRSDLFSLGVVLYESISQALPFGGATATEVITAIVRDPPRPLVGGLLRDPQARGLLEILEWCLRKAPEDRPQKARALVEALDQLRDTASSLGSGEAQPTASSPPGAGVRSDASHPSPPTIAILPFVNLSQAAEDDWIGTGIAETLVTDLKAATGLDVVGRDQWTGPQVTGEPGEGDPGDGAAIAEARRIGACGLVTGAVQRIGSRLRVTARATEVGTGEVLHVVKVDGELNELFRLQDQVVEGLAAGMERLRAARGAQASAPGRRPAPTAVPPADPALRSGATPPPGPPSLEAFESFARGAELFRSSTRQSLAEAIGLFEHAVDLHPPYALAWATLAGARQISGAANGQRDLIEQAVEAARCAVALDSRLATGHQWLGSSLSSLGEYPEALEHLETAVRLEPSSATAHTILARLNWFHLGRVRRGLDHLERAAELNPDAGHVFLQLGFLYGLTGDHDAAEAASRRAIELQHEPPEGDVVQIVGGYLRLGYTFYRRRRLDEALRHYRQEERFLATLPDHSLQARTQLELHQKLGATLLRQGRGARAERHLNHATEGYAARRSAGADEPSTRFYAACAHALLDEPDRAVELFRECVRDLPHFTRWRAATDPDLEAVRDRLELTPPTPPDSP